MSQRNETSALEVEPGSPEKALTFLIEKAHSFLPIDYFPEWQKVCIRLSNAGYGSLVPLSFARHSPKLAKYIRKDAISLLAKTVSLAAIKTNRASAEMLSKSALTAAKQYHSTPSFLSWLNTIEELIKFAPEALLPVLERMEKIVGTLDHTRFKSWVITGLRSTGDNVLHQIDYFTFVDPESEKWFRHEAGDIVLTDIERKLKLFLTSLWGINPSIRNLPMSMSPLASRRISISNGVIRMPEVFSGIQKSQLESLFYAGTAHAGAHLVYSKQRFKVADLKPIQVTLVSLLEDARVEYLAMQKYPGLRSLWSQFHMAKASGPKLIPHLLARLSRALIDDEYFDTDGWVQKGRDLFNNSIEDIDKPEVFRRIGVILGNDLGQLRAQFNAKTYVVEPAYRDDNLGLWDFANEESDLQDSELLQVESVKSDPKESENPSNSNKSESSEEKNEHVDSASLSESVETGKSYISKKYPEYDYLTGYERPNWSCAVEYYPEFGDKYKIDNILESHKNLVNRIKKLIQSAKVSSPERLYKQNVGESLDIDACINAVISKKMGISPDPNIYSTTIRKHRDLSVLVLLDVSNSTNDKVPNTNSSILDLELQATSILAYAMSELNDPFAIAAFSSNGKDDVHYYRIKDFSDNYDDTTKAYLSALKGKLSTRIGTAMRHAISDLSSQKSHRRLLLVITDGEPSDIDTKDNQYLVEDARKVTQNNSKHGIDTFCVGLDKGGEGYLKKIFGRKNYTLINNLSLLPARLTYLYLRLTT